MTVRRWGRPVLAVVAVWLVLQLVLGWLEFDPSPLPLAGSVALAAAVWWLAWTAAETGSAHWGPRFADTARGPRQDRRLGTLLRVVENHLAGSEPDPVLAGHLRRLARTRLAAHRGVPSDLPDSHPDVVAGLGAGLTELFDDPSRKLRPAEIARALDRIEAL